MAFKLVYVAAALIGGIIETSPVAPNIVLDGPRDAEFVYDNTGALIASIAPSIGTDSAGNHYIAGFTAYDQSGLFYAELAAGVLQMGTLPSAGGAPDTTHSSTFATSTNGELLITGGSNAIDTAALQAIWNPGTPASAPGQTTTPRIILINEALTPAADLWLSGAVVKSTAGGVNYTWQNVANSGIVLGAGWASNLTAGGAQDIEMRLDAEDNLIITGTLHTTSATPTATIWTLAAPYIPKVLQRDVQVLTRTGGVNTPNILSISSSTGAVSLVTALAAASIDVYINAVIPLGNIA